MIAPGNEFVTLREQKERVARWLIELLSRIATPDVERQLHMHLSAMGKEQHASCLSREFPVNSPGAGG